MILIFFLRKGIWKKEKATNDDNDDELCIDIFQHLLRHSHQEKAWQFLQDNIEILSRHYHRIYLDFPIGYQPLIDYAIENNIVIRLDVDVYSTQTVLGQVKPTRHEKFCLFSYLRYYNGFNVDAIVIIYRDVLRSRRYDLVDEFEEIIDKRSLLQVDRDNLIGISSIKRGVSMKDGYRYLHNCMSKKRKDRNEDIRRKMCSSWHRIEKIRCYLYWEVPNISNSLQKVTIGVIEYGKVDKRRIPIERSTFMEEGLVLNRVCLLHLRQDSRRVTNEM